MWTGADVTGTNEDFEFYMWISKRIKHFAVSVGSVFIRVPFA